MLAPLLCGPIEINEGAALLYTTIALLSMALLYHKSSEEVEVIDTGEPLFGSHPLPIFNGFFPP